jgi:hypothetical protein
LAKLIVLILAGVLVYLVLKNYRKRVQRGREHAADGAESMVRCAKCGLHHPRSESLLSDGKYFCSPEHEQQGRGSR